MSKLVGYAVLLRILHIENVPGSRVENYMPTFTPPALYKRDERKQGNTSYGGLEVCSRKDVPHGYYDSHRFTSAFPVSTLRIFTRMPSLGRRY